MPFKVITKNFAKNKNIDISAPETSLKQEENFQEDASAIVMKAKKKKKKKPFQV